MIMTCDIKKMLFPSTYGSSCGYEFAKKFLLIDVRWDPFGCPPFVWNKPSIIIDHCPGKRRTKHLITTHFGAPLTSILPKGLHTMTSNVWSWGWEREGCLGLPENTEADDSEYVRIPRPVLLENVVQIASGNSHVLALTNSGDIYSWGRTASGRLGYVTGKEKQPLPLEVYSGLKFSQVACGSHHNLALTVQGQIASWGSGFSGQCGQNNKLDIEKPTIISSTGTTKFIKVSAGYYHSMALDGTPHIPSPLHIFISFVEEKNVWIWGTGKDGQLGLGSQTTALTPVLLKFDKRLKFTQIVASEFNSFAMTTSGQVFMWGGNRYGIIGNGLYGPSIVAWTPSLLALRM